MTPVPDPPDIGPADRDREDADVDDVTDEGDPVAALQTALRVQQIGLNRLADQVRTLTTLLQRATAGQDHDGQPAANPGSPSSRRTTCSPRRGARWAARNANTSAGVTSAGGLPTTPKKIFKSDATASQVLVRARAATNER